MSFYIKYLHKRAKAHNNPQRLLQYLYQNASRLYLYPFLLYNMPFYS
jgi:hypothetical protein